MWFGNGLYHKLVENLSALGVGNWLIGWVGSFTSNVDNINRTFVNASST